MDTKLEKRRNAFIFAEVSRAAVEIGKLRQKGEFVCDVAYIEGVMIEAKKIFDGLHQNSKT
jgi:hypothetical protein